jgi:hypothetical protein
MQNVWLPILLGVPLMGCGGAATTLLLEEGDAASSPDVAGDIARSPDAGSDQSTPPPDAGARVDAAETGADVAPCAPCLLTVDYFTSTTSPTTTQIQANIEIVNTGSTALDLGTVTVRYWFTADGSKSQVFNCDYATSSSPTDALGCVDIAATFMPLATPAAEADTYMQLSFSGGAVPGGGGTAEIELQFHDVSYAMFTQTNDYSFNATFTAFTAWNHITMYVNGALVWGVEP